MNDNSILEGLFRQHCGKMIHLARTLLHDDDESKDVVQDVFARLLENDYQMTGSKTEAYLMSATERLQDMAPPKSTSTTRKYATHRNSTASVPMKSSRPRSSPILA